MNPFAKKQYLYLFDGCVFLLIKLYSATARNAYTIF